MCVCPQAPEELQRLVNVVRKEPLPADAPPLPEENPTEGTSGETDGGEGFRFWQNTFSFSQFKLFSLPAISFVRDFVHLYILHCCTQCLNPIWMHISWCVYLEVYLKRSDGLLCSEMRWWNEPHWGVCLGNSRCVSLLLTHTVDTGNMTLRLAAQYLFGFNLLQCKQSLSKETQTQLLVE